MTTNLFFSSEDARVRKRWLITALFLIFVSVLVQLIMILGTEVEPDKGSQVVAETGLNLIVYIAFSLLFFAIAYHCAYKKQGTRWLMFSIIVSTFFLVTTLGCCFIVPEVRENWLTMGALLLSAATQGWWIWSCVRLRKVNKPFAILKRAQKAFAQSKNSEILGLHHESLIKRWPQFEPAISQEFEKAKQTLGPA